MSNLQDKDDPIYISAKMLLDNLDERILSYYITRIENQQVSYFLHETMNEWFTEKSAFSIEPEVTLLNIIYYIIETSAMQMESTTAALEYYSENKRARKNYMFSTIKKEYTGEGLNKNNAMFLNKTADTYFELLKVSSTIPKYSSKQEYIDIMYQEISSWRNDRESYLFDFKFFECLDPKRRAGCFILDVGTFIFKMVTEQFYGKIDGGVTLFPANLMDGVFSLRNESVDLDIVVGNNIAYSRSQNIIDNGEGQTVEVETIYGKVEGDFSMLPEELSDEEKFAMVNKLRVGNELSSTVRSLASREFVTLTTIYSSFSASNLLENHITFNGKKFVQQVLGKKNIKIRDIKQVLESIEKLASAEINLTRTNSQGKVDFVGKISFFDMSYGIDERDEDSKLNYTIDKNSQDYQMIDDSILSGNNWKIHIAPSAYLREQWAKEVNSVIYTKQYMKISDSKTKSYMVLLQDERMKSYPSMTKTFTFAYLGSKLRMDKMRPAYMKKEVAEQLMALKSANVIVEDYKITSTGSVVSFLPFTELEKELYGIDKDTIPLLTEIE